MQTKTVIKPLLAGLFASLLFSTPAWSDPEKGVAVPVVLAEKGVARFPIVVAESASRETKSNAETLAEYLSKMTGASFTIEEGDGSTGIVFGKQEDFNLLPKRFAPAVSKPRTSEEYLLYSHAGGLLLVGNSDLAAQDALWDFLARQGYRQYFPGDVWEIIPKIETLSVACNEVQSPDFITRQLWYTSGTYPEREKLYHDWCVKNRMKSGFTINAGHAYEHFISRYKSTLDQHPEYYALVGGERKGAKLAVANPELRKLFVEYSLGRMRADPEATSVSAEPSDGGGWDESPEGKAIGSPSNQAVLLANEVAEAVEKEFPGCYVGMYAYNFHSDPPTIPVRSNVYVLCTTYFRGTSLSLFDQLRGWEKQGATVGVRDFLSYPAENYDLPARCKGFRLTEIGTSIRNYHSMGTPIYSAQAGDNWVINGLLYYTVAKVLWDVKEADKVDGLRSEFLRNCFGPAAETVRPYFEALAPAGNPVLAPDLFNRLYTALEKARAQNPGEAVEARLDELTLYVRYLELYKNYADATGPERLQRVREMFSHLYRGRLTSANHARGIMRDLNGRDKAFSWSDEEKKSLRKGIPIWEKNPTYQRSDIIAMASDGIKNNPRLEFSPVSYSRELVPAAPLFSHSKTTKAGALAIPTKGALYYTWAEQPGSEWRLRLSCKADANKEAAPQLEFWAANEAEEKPVETRKIPVPVGGTAEIVLKSPHEGLHWLILTHITNLAGVEFDSGKHWTVTSSTDSPFISQGGLASSSLYFYVPKGTKVIGAHMPGRGELLDPEGNLVRNFEKDGYFKVDVSKGQDGSLWKVNNLRGGNFLLLTVPPYFAATPQQLLLPKEVVKADLIGR